MLSKTGNTVRVRFTWADPNQMISHLTDHGVILTAVEFIDDITATFQVSYMDYKAVKAIFMKKDIPFEVISQRGILLRARMILRRPVLIFGMVLYIILTLFVPNRILFVSVEGNRDVAPESILSAAEETGLYFGAARKSIRSEKIKNLLLQKIPELQWVGVNTKGCVAVISVKERARTEAVGDDTGIYSIVASRDGIIRQMTVHSGNPLCTAGQSVRKGQVLVSGFKDCGICVRVESANAEVFADTIRNIEVKVPAVWRSVAENSTRKKKYSVIFGKKRINLFKDTGISDTTCGKMYKQYYMNLPGNFTLPLTVIEYTEEFAESDSLRVLQAESVEWVSDAASTYLQQQMLSGSVLNCVAEMEQTQDVFIYHAIYTCREMIGQLRSEEIYDTNEYTN